MSILPPADAVPLLLDRSVSPVVALDTEFDASKPTCQADLRGLSLAGGTPGNLFATFWGFGNGNEAMPWGWLRDRVLKPLFRDPERAIVMHPPKVDMQPLRARGLTEDDVRCQIECTMSHGHIFDENLPKSLKDQGDAILGIESLVSHTQVVKEMRRLRKAGKTIASKTLQACWVVYRDERKKSKEEEVEIDPTWPSWRRVTMRLPPGLKKKEVQERLEPRIRGVIEGDHERQAQARYAHYGALDALITLGVRYFYRDGIPGVIDGIPPSQLEHLALETRICHPVVTEMEERGLKIDVELLAHIRDRMAESIEHLEARLKQRWGPAWAQVDPEKEWNPNSADQVAQVVWGVWGLRPPPWTMRGGELKPQFLRKKDGLCSTKDDVLTYLVNRGGARAQDLEELLEYRRLTKLQGTYVEPMLEMALADPDHRLHPSFWPVGARTGRFAHSDPNVGNIPRPHTMPTLPIPPGADPSQPPPGLIYEAAPGKKTVWRVRSLRDVFIAPQRMKLVSADLAQIENRLIAHEAQDPTLLHLFRGWDCAACGESGETNEPLHACPRCGAAEGKRNKADPAQPAVEGFCLGRDIHAMTAHALGLVEKHGFKEGRQRAKADNHAFNYGMGGATLARREGMTVREADEHLRMLDRTYPRVRSYLHTKMKHDVREQGQVVMFDGHIRRFYAPRRLMRSGNFKNWEWEGVVREAVNVLAQGGTGVIMKRAMWKIRERLRAKAIMDPRYGEVYLVNQVHDELLYEAPEEIADDVLAVICYELEHAAPELAVPVIAEGATGRTWGEAH